MSCKPDFSPRIQEGFGMIQGRIIHAGWSRLRRIQRQSGSSSLVPSAQAQPAFPPPRSRPLGPFRPDRMDNRQTSRHTAWRFADQTHAAKLSRSSCSAISDENCKWRSMISLMVRSSSSSLTTSGNYRDTRFRKPGPHRRQTSFGSARYTDWADREPT